MFLMDLLSIRDLSVILFSQSYPLFCGLYLAVFYLTFHVLIPKFYFPKKYLYFFGSLSILFLIIFLLHPFGRLIDEARYFRDFGTSGKVIVSPNAGFPFRDPPVDIVSVYFFFAVTALSMAFRIAEKWRDAERWAIKAEADKAKAELSILRAQISPHLLFNTLNNIYTLAISKNDATAESIMRLSDILRYITDDAGKDYVPLKDEIKFIKDYIDLQRLRLGASTSLDFEVNGKADDKMIAPLILITFIENAFKYGISKHEVSPVTIKISAENGAIRFFSENKIYKNHRKVSREGIGIKNACERLAHLYPDKHSLRIDNESERFSVMLHLQL